MRWSLDPGRTSVRLGFVRSLARSLARWVGFLRVCIIVQQLVILPVIMYVTCLHIMCTSIYIFTHITIYIYTYVHVTYLYAHTQIRDEKELLLCGKRAQRPQKHRGARTTHMHCNSTHMYST